MDHDTFSAIAHRDHRYLNPVGVATMEAVYDLLHLAPGARVVDLGCGKAEALVRLMELYGVQGVGIDRNPRFIAEARQRAAAIVPDGMLELIESDIADFHPPAASFDLALCIGSTQVFGGLKDTIRELGRFVVSGGMAVVGEGYWRKPTPDREYLDFLGSRATDLQDHEGNQRMCAERGWELLRSFTSSHAEWDAYEELYLEGVERHARERPGDPEVPAMLERIRAWHHAYQFLGRENLGFGLYLLRRPP